MHGWLLVGVQRTPRQLWYPGFIGYIDLFISLVSLIILSAEDLFVLSGFRDRLQLLTTYVCLQSHLLGGTARLRGIEPTLFVLLLP